MTLKVRFIVFHLLFALGILLIADPVAGSVYVFAASIGTDWSQQQKLVASDAATGDEFGVSLSMAGDVMAVGARFNSNEGGVVHVSIV